MNLVYKENSGSFVKHCPCTPDAVSCGYYNLNLHTGCPFSCTYCILQAYLESKDPVFFTNLNTLESEIDLCRQKQPNLRIGSGELSDSLAYQGIMNYPDRILQIFSGFPQVIFEFKTKSVHISQLISQPTILKNIVISWSLNPSPIIQNEEIGTPDLKQRLEAIQAVMAAGYKIGIHFDPIIYIKEWQKHYQQLIKMLSGILNPSQIAWWSLGGLRFPYALRDHIFKHHHSHLFSGELIKGYDGKYRYFKPLRLEMFSKIAKFIFDNISKETPLYLCMEDKSVWQEILPHISPTEADVNYYLYESAFK